jgi:acyl dehydratase
MAEAEFDGIEDVRSALGRHLGYSDWVSITQDRIDTFADATGDHQWIHVDPERAGAGPYGAPVAHGYLTLALTNMLLPQVVAVHGVSAGINYGVDRVRFPAPVRVGERVRAGVELTDVVDVPGGIQTTMRITVEIEHGEKPACVVDALSRWML